MNAFLDRPVEGEWPYPWLDATYLKVRPSRSALKVRDNGRIVSVAAMIAAAVTTEGRREIPGSSPTTGLGIGPPPRPEPFWSVGDLQ